MAKYLTSRVLYAIIYMGSVIEADGVDNLQRHGSGPEQEQAFTDCMDAMGWAASVRA